MRSSLIAIFRAFPCLLVSIHASAQGLGEQLGFNPFHSGHLTLETPHFRITHEPRHAELARLAARHLEEAHRVLAPVMKWQPLVRTQVVMLDNSDFANGLAGAVGRLGMVLWTTPPDNWMSIAHYDDWFRMLCFHEYAHILNMDILKDFYVPLRWVFGDSIRPNSLWTRWMLEGLAVSQETSFTSAGRGRSSYYGMLRRGVWRAGMLKPARDGGWGIGQITGERTIPPGGEVPYFFGHELMNELADGDPSRLGVLSSEAAGSLPYFYNRYATLASGRDWTTLWESWAEKASRRSEQEVAAVEAAGRTEPEWISKGNYQSFRPAFSPDGRFIAYGRERYDEQPVLAIRDLEAPKGGRAERRLIENIGGGSVAFTADGGAVVFSTIEREGLYDFMSQLWVHEIASGRTYALSLPKGAQSIRAKDPDIRGDRVVFTMSTPGRVGVALGRLSRGPGGRLALDAIEPLFEPGLLGRASTPRLSPDGRRIVFSLHENGENFEKLMVLERTGDEGPWALRELVTQAGARSGTFDRFPSWIDDQTIVFSSNRTGIDNVYRLSLAPEAGSRAPRKVPFAEAITNVESAAWYPVPAPAGTHDGQMVAAIYTPTGWELAWIRPSVVSPPQVDTETLTPIAPSAAPPAETAPQSEADWKLSPYSSYPSILPRLWSPLVLSSASGGLSVNAAVAGFDALDVHRYQLQAGFDTGLSVPEAQFEYSNRALGAVWTLNGASRIQGVGLSSFQREDSVGMTLSLFRPMTEAYWNPSIGWAWERLRLLDRSSGEVLDQLFAVPQIRAVLNYSNTDTSRQSVITEEGWRGALGHQWSLGSRQTGNELLWTHGHYLHLGGHSVLWPHWQLALSDSDTVQVEGRRNQLVDSFPGFSFDQLVMRGYPQQVYRGLRNAAVASLDLRFPIRRVEQGLSTYPVFFDVLQGLAFAETSWLGVAGAKPVALPAWGAGVRGDWVILNYVPLVTAVEYHQGTEKARGGKSELFFELRLGGLSF
jgi:hypothetical protein